MNLELNKCSLDDKNEIWALFLESMKPHIEKIWGWDVEWQLNEFNGRYFELNTSFVLLDGKRIGYVQYTLLDDETYVDMLILYPENRSLGYGVPILTLLDSLQKENSLKLRCFKVNESAYRFYLDNGFELVDDEENFYLLRWCKIAL